MEAQTRDWVTRAPPPKLRSFIDGYLGYRLTESSPGLHRGVPSRHMTFIVSVGPEIDVVTQTDRRQQPARYACVISGLQASSALISHDGHQEGVAIELSPTASRALLGMPARELWDRSYEFEDVVGRIGHELWERMQFASTWEERFAVCDDVLWRLGPHDESPAELTGSWNELVASGGRISIQDLSEETGYSRQHLTRRFRSEFGLGPKLAARIVRFERARRMLHSIPPFVTYAQVAASVGYYDQAHMYRDFSELAGCTPRQLLAEDVPNFQEQAAVPAP
jgi:AraC-like DNA-binding protein